MALYRLSGGLGRILQGVLLCLWITPGLLLAEERIISFLSDITVQQDGVLEVEETITVIAEGREIRRGIYRDFPTIYAGPGNTRHTVGFEIIGVTRNHQDEPYHTETRSNGIRIYIGHKNRFIQPGQHQYRISYRSTRQLGFFENHDELYWNVTGNGWAFPISETTAKIILPHGVPSQDIALEAYTGYSGEKGQDYRASVNGLGEAEFRSTRVLSANEGLTVVVQWPKGFVTKPSALDNFWYFMADNRVAMVGSAGLVVVLAYYLISWMRVGRDPEQGTIVPLFNPPAGLSPAAMRYIYRMGFDNRAYSAAIINMAVKGVLTINEVGGKFSVERHPEGSMDSLTAGERKILNALLGGGHNITFKKTNHRPIRKSINALKGLLKREYQRAAFSDNVIYLVPGIIISIAVLLGAGLGSKVDTQVPIVVMSVWLAGWSFTVFILIRQGQKLMAAIFGLAEIFVISGMLVAVPIVLTIAIIGLIALNIVFYYLMKAPTPSGRKLMDRIEGFRLYLATAEEDRLNALNPPDKTPELFEKFLPYALALGVDQAWSEKFSKILEQSAIAPGDSGYRPRWYRGSRLSDFDPGAFTSGLGSSLATAVSSASTKPGSSSGGGGGGFSGGGGGGGGGGGW